MGVLPWVPTLGCDSNLLYFIISIFNNKINNG